MKLGNDINLSEQDDVQLDPDLEQNRYPDLTGATSIMSKYLTREVFERLTDKKTSTGFTIARAVNKAKSLMGCHADGTDSYSQIFFDPVIEEYHRGFKPEDKHITDMNVESGWPGTSLVSILLLVKTDQGREACDRSSDAESV